MGNQRRLALFLVLSVAGGSICLSDVDAGHKKAVPHDPDTVHCVLSGVVQDGSPKPIPFAENKVLVEAVLTVGTTTNRIAVVFNRKDGKFDLALPKCVPSVDVIFTEISNRANTFTKPAVALTSADQPLGTITLPLAATALAQVKAPAPQKGPDAVVGTTFTITGTVYTNPQLTITCPAKDVKIQVLCPDNTVCGSCFNKAGGTFTVQFDNSLCPQPPTTVTLLLTPQNSNTQPTTYPASPGTLPATGPTSGLQIYVPGS